MIMTEDQLDLLNKPRIICIADYPGNTYSLNEEIPLDWNDNLMSWEYKDCSRQVMSNYYSKFPHLFKVLLWFKNREISDMPEYVRWLDGVSYRVLEHNLDDYRCVVEGIGNIQYANCLPTNKAGYIPKM